MMKSVYPPNLGWVEQKLKPEAMKFLWDIIDIGGTSLRSKLAGNINSSYKLIDKNDWFFKKVVTPTIKFYADEFHDPLYNFPMKRRVKYCLADIWVNYQKQTEFNPIHTHTGIFSFVIWMKIPTKFEDQKKLPIADGVNSRAISSFEIGYQNILGESLSHIYNMDPAYEGTMLLFPSKLSHAVYPFYKCDEDRISISGNIMVE